MSNITTIPVWKADTNYVDGALASAATLLEPSSVIKTELNCTTSIVDLMTGSELELWDASTTYIIGYIIRFDDGNGMRFYESLQNPNLNQSPEVSIGTYWKYAEGSNNRDGFYAASSDIHSSVTNSGMVYINDIDGLYYLVTDPDMNNIIGYLNIDTYFLTTEGIVEKTGETFSRGEWIYLSDESLGLDGEPLSTDSNRVTYRKLGIALSTTTFYLKVNFDFSAGTLDEPILTGTTTGSETTTIQLQISNYNELYTYYINLTGGSFVRTGLYIDWTLPEVASETSHTISISVNYLGKDSSILNYNVLVSDVGDLIDDGILVTDFAAVEQDIIAITYV